MKRPLIIIGAGGHSKVLLDILQDREEDILGLTEANDTRQNDRILDIPIIGQDQVIFQFDPEFLFLVNGIGKIDRGMHRQELFLYFKRYGYQFTQVIHHSAVVSSHVQLSEGIQVMAGAVIQAGSIIGENSIINTRAALDHDVYIGAHVHIAPGAIISGGVKVGDGTLIGAGATIIQGIKIGSNSIVAAGSVVVKDVADGVTVMGVPAKVVDKR